MCKNSCNSKRLINFFLVKPLKSESLNVITSALLHFKSCLWCAEAKLQTIDSKQSFTSPVTWRLIWSSAHVASSSRTLHYLPYLQAFLVTFLWFNLAANCFLPLPVVDHTYNMLTEHHSPIPRPGAPLVYSFYANINSALLWPPLQTQG